MSIESRRLDQPEQAALKRQRDHETPSPSQVSGSGRAGVAAVVAVVLGNIVV